MGIRDKPTAPASPWQNGFAERLIGSIRCECVDHIIVLGEMHLRRVLKSYADYYNSVRTHRSLKRMRRSLAKFSEAEASDHMPSSADFITTAPELKFSAHTRSDTSGARIGAGAPTSLPIPSPNESSTSGETTEAER